MTKRFIWYFQCFMTPFHCFHLGFSGGYTLYLPFSVLHDPIPLLSSRVFWRLYTFFLPFSVLHEHHSTTFIYGLLEAIRFVCHFHCFMTPFHYFHLGSFGGCTLYLQFSVLHGPIFFLSSRVFWRLYALFAIFSTS